jgi:hypothetical protein
MQVRSLAFGILCSGDEGLHFTLADQEMSESEEDQSQYDRERDDHANVQECRSRPHRAQEESEEEDQESEEGEPSTSRHPAQTMSRVSSAERSLGGEQDAIEVDGDASEGEIDEEGRTHDNQSGSDRSGGEGRLSPSGQYDDEEYGSEDAAQGGRTEPYEDESDQENGAEQPLASLRQSQRPSDYDVDGSETGSGYASDAQVDADRDDLQGSYDDDEAESAVARDGIQEMSEDELAGDDDADVAAPGGVDQPEYWRPTRTAQVASQWDPISDIDPVLSGDTEVAETQEMVQISSHGLAVESLVQMAYSLNAPRNQDDLVLDIDHYASDQPITSVAHQEVDLAGESAEIILEGEPYDEPSATEYARHSDLQDEASGEIEVHSPEPPERGMPPADFATEETASTHDDMTSGDFHNLPASLTRSPGAQEEDENMAEDMDRSPQPMGSTVETLADHQAQISPSVDESDANEELVNTGGQDSSPAQDIMEAEHTAVIQSQEDYNRDVEMASEVDKSAPGSVDGTHGNQEDEATGSQGGSTQSAEVDDEHGTRSPSAEREYPERNQGSPDFPLPEPEGYNTEAQGDQHIASDFDRNADFVHLTTPSNDEDDELEEGEIRDGDEDEAPALLEAEGARQEGIEADSDSLERQADEADADGDSAYIGAEVDLDLRLDPDVDLDVELAIEVQADIETGK